ncbi:MAG: hypothetical protein ACRDKI_06140 [Solirubrobacterales bacterium]
MRVLKLFLITAAFALVCASSAAASTQLKPKTNWGTKGLFTLSTNLPGTFEYVSNCVVTGNEKLVALAQSASGGKYRQIAFKLNKHGRIERRGNGRRYLTVGSSSNRPITSTIDGNGHIYFAFRRGKSQTVYLSRTKTDLSADKRFGRITLPAALYKRADGSFSGYRGVVIFPQFDGGVLVAVQSGATASVLTRIAPNGKVDSTFGTGGSVTYPAFVVRAIDAKSSGPAYLAGVSAADRGLVQRILANGAPDPAYATGGIADVGGTSVSSRLDGIVAETDGSVIVKRFRRDQIPGQPAADTTLIIDVTRITPAGLPDDKFPHSGEVDNQTNPSHSAILLLLYPASDNAPDTEMAVLHGHGDGVFAGYFASRLGTYEYGNYFWLDGAGNQLGFPKSADDFFVKKSPIYTTEAVPALRGGFYACGALAKAKSFTHAKIAIARYAP